MERIIVTGGPGSRRREIIRRLFDYQKNHVSDILILENYFYWNMTSQRHKKDSSYFRTLWKIAFETQILAESTGDHSFISAAIYSCGFPDLACFDPDNRYTDLCEENEIGKATDRYDKVIFLETVAKAWPNKYPYASNGDMIDLYEACILNDKLRDNWIRVIGKENMRIIPAQKSFDDKARLVFSAIEYARRK